MAKLLACSIFQKGHQGRSSVRQRYYCKKCWNKTILIMSNEDPGKNMHWQDKLEGMDHLPGEGFNKNSSWNKLHERLQDKKKKTPLWYWAAAACLLCALMIAWLMNDKTQPQVSKTDVKSKQPDKI